MSKKKIYWTFSPIINIPTIIYPDPMKYFNYAPCPVTNKYANRTRLLLTPYDVEIQPVFTWIELEQKYVFNNFNISSKDLDERHLWTPDTVIDTGEELWYDSAKAQFQIIMPYIFLSEEDINMSLIGVQKSETASELDDLLFIEASLNIKEQIRPLSSAWAFQKMQDTKAHFKKNQPHMKIHFSDDVELIKFSSTPLFQQWWAMNNGVTQYARGTSKYFKLLDKRRPKHLWKEIKANSDYSEV